MKKYFFTLISFLCLQSILAQTYAQDYVFDFTKTNEYTITPETTLTKGEVLTGLTFTKDGFSVKWAKPSGLDTKFYEDHIRFYAGQEMIVTAPEGVSISKIVFTMSGSYNSSLLNPNIGTIDGTNDTWTGSANSITFTNTSSGQIRFSAITITAELPAGYVAAPEIAEVNAPELEGKYYTHGAGTGNITITSATEGAEISYTIDGGQAITGPSPLTIADGITATAPGVHTLVATATLNGNSSEAVTKTYTFINKPVFAPTIEAANAHDHNDSYFTNGAGTGAITISTTSEGAEISYSIDGAPAVTAPAPVTIVEGITASTPGSHTITAKAILHGESSTETSVTYNFIDKPKSIIFTKITSDAQLIPGMRYIIADADASHVMSPYVSGGNNLKATSLAPSGDSYEIIDQAAIITLGGEPESYTLHTAEGYLYAPNAFSGSKNYLRVQPTVDENAQWTITVSSDGTASIVVTGATGRGTLMYNSNNTLFACYAGGQKPVSLYMEKVDAVDTATGLDMIVNDGEIGTNYRINTTLIGRYYDAANGVLIASTKPGESANYTTPTPAEAEHYWSDKAELYEMQSDWVALKGDFNAQSVGMQINPGLIGKLTAKAPYYTINVVSYTKATEIAPLYNTPTYAVINFFNSEAQAKGLYKVIPRVGEYLKVKGAVLADQTAAILYDESDRMLDMDLSGIDQQVYEDSQWYEFTGVVTIEPTAAKTQLKNAPEGYSFKLVVTEAPKILTSVEGIGTDEVRVVAGKGEINVDGAEKVAVYSLNGMLISTEAHTQCAAGVYIVRINDKAVKVMVK